MAGKERLLFPQKLFRMVEDEEDDLIKWPKNVEGFLICNDQEKLLHSKILEKNEMKNKYDSFNRQLNLYGFHKHVIPDQEEADKETQTKYTYFCHDHHFFMKGRHDLLVNIKKYRGPNKCTSSKEGAEVGRNTYIPDLEGVNPSLFYSLENPKDLMNYLSESDEREYFRDVMEVVNNDSKDSADLKDSAYELRNRQGETIQSGIAANTLEPFELNRIAGTTETGYSSGASSTQAQELYQENAVTTRGSFTLCQSRGTAYSSDEGSLSEKQTFTVTINPKSGPPEGGQCFSLEFDKSLPSSVTSAWASFGHNGQEKVSRTYDDDLTMFGKKIPPGQPGLVTVTVITESGVYLGETVFTYENPNKRTINALDDTVQYLAKKIKQLQEGEDAERNGGSFVEQGLVNQERHLEPEKILKPLVYAAAEAGSIRLIETIFRLPAGRNVFEAYKEESCLPEHIAEENGHGDVALYLRGITKRYSEEFGANRGGSSTIPFDWFGLANALEKIDLCNSAMEPSPDKDFKRLLEDDTTETEYSAVDGERSSSGSEKDISDFDDKFNNTSACKGRKNTYRKQVVRGEISEKVYFGDTENSSNSDQERTEGRKNTYRKQVVRGEISEKVYFGDTENSSNSDQEQTEGGFDALDEAFEHFGSLQFDEVDVFIDSQFDRVLRSAGEEEICSSSLLVTAESDSKLVVQRGNGLTMATVLNSFEFTYGSDTHVDFDGAMSLSRQEEIKRSGVICSRCLEVVDKDYFKRCYASSKGTTGEEASNCGCAGGIQLKEGKESLPTCETVSDGEVLSLMVKCNSNTKVDGKLILCEDAHGNKYITKAINNSVGPWNFEEIQKNKDSIDAETCAGISDPVQNTESSKKDQNDAKMSPQDVTHLLLSCKEQHTLCQGIYNALIQLIGEVALLGEDNFMCIKQLYDFTKELKEQEKTFLPKIEGLFSLKEHLDKSQIAQVEELDKWRRTQKEQVQGVEKLLSSLIQQGKNQKMLKRRSKPVINIKQPHGFARRRTKTDSSKGSGKSQSLSELPGADKKSNISGPVCVQQLYCLDTYNKLKNEKS